MDKNLKYAVIIVLAMIFALNVVLFLDTRVYLNTDEEWKFYFSLTGLVIFTLLFVANVYFAFIKNKKQ